MTFKKIENFFLNKTKLNIKKCLQCQSLAFQAFLEKADWNFFDEMHQLLADRLSLVDPL